ncbi:MAG: hypothetical protein ACYTFO_08470 [Planctomycetota bacterium]
MTIDRQHEQEGERSGYSATYYALLRITHGARPGQMRRALTVERIVVTYSYDRADQVYDSADMLVSQDHPQGYLIGRTVHAELDASGSIITAEFTEADLAALIEDGLEEWLEGMALSISLFAEEVEFYLPLPRAETGDTWVAEREGMGTYACGNIALAYGWGSPVQETAECQVESASGGEGGTARVITYSAIWRPAETADAPGDRWTVPERTIAATGQVTYDPDGPIVVSVERRSTMTLQAPPNTEPGSTALSLTETFQLSPIPSDDEVAGSDVEEDGSEDQQDAGDTPPADNDGASAADTVNDVEGD